MGLISVVRHDFERAQALYEESLKLARETDDRVGVDYALWLGALAALGRGEHERVRALCGEGLDLARQIGHTHGVALILHVLAASFGTQGRAVPSARLWGAAESLLDTSGRALGPAERHFYGPYIASARSRLGDTAWEEAWSEGRAMTPERAIEYALLEKEEPRTTAPKKPPVGKQPVTLTRREWEIAALVARGLSNRRIASELVISERTAGNHVSRILRKLGLDSRAQIASWVTEQPLHETGPG